MVVTRKSLNTLGVTPHESCKSVHHQAQDGTTEPDRGAAQRLSTPRSPSHSAATSSQSGFDGIRAGVRQSARSKSLQDARGPVWRSSPGSKGGITHIVVIRLWGISRQNILNMHTLRGTRVQKPGASAAFVSECTACKADGGNKGKDNTSKQEEKKHVWKFAAVCCCCRSGQQRNRNNPGQ